MHRLTGPALLLALCSCGGSDTEDSAQVPVVTSPHIVVDPPTLEFPLVLLGEEGLLPFTIQNTGDAPLNLMWALLETDTGAFSIDDPEALLLMPGDVTYAVVHYTPTFPGQETGTVTVLSDDPEARELALPLVGNCVGGTLDLQVETPDLGEVEVGCTGSSPVTVTNTGGANLRVTGWNAASPSNEISFVIDEAGGPLPWTLAPSESRMLGYVVYAPLQEGTDAAELTVSSDAAEDPTQTVLLGGTGTVYSRVQQHVQFKSTQADVMIVVNGSGDMAEPLETFYAAYPVFHEALRAYATSFQVIAITQAHCVAGSIKFVDGSYTGEDAVEVIRGQLAHVTELSRVVYMLDLAVYHVVRPAECNTGSLRDGNHWSLVGFTNAADTSPDSAESYIASITSRKGDDNFTIDGIAGDDPDGCSDAEAWGKGNEAIDLTGGAFMSICSEDWEADITEFARKLALKGPIEPVYDLDAIPIAETLEVYMNGLPLTDGWIYDSSKNQVVFSVELDGEDDVDLFYTVPHDCE